VPHLDYPNADVSRTSSPRYINGVTLNETQGEAVRAIVAHAAGNFRCY